MSIFVSRHQLGGDSKLCSPPDAQLLESVSNRSQVAQLCLNSEAGKSVLCLTQPEPYLPLAGVSNICVAVKQSKKPYFQSNAALELSFSAFHSI